MTDKNLNLTNHCSNGTKHKQLRPQTTQIPT